MYATDLDLDEVVAEVVSMGTHAVPAEHDPPHYPRRAIKDFVEGRVVVSFIVKADGTPDGIVILDASIEKYFDKEAINTVCNWTYKPATWNGNPVTQAKKNVRLSFYGSARNRVG